MKNKIKAKILGLLLISSMLTSCQQAINPTNPVIINENKGMANWEEFKELSGANFENTIDNFEDIKGFTGYALYSEIEKFMKSDIYGNITKRYDTKGLEIFFDSYGENETTESGIEQNESITPSLLNEIYKRFTHINITGINNLTGSFEYIKISSGLKQEVFDINKFYERLTKGELSIKGIVSQPQDEETIIGIDDEYLNNHITTNIEKIKYLLNNDFFSNASIGKVILSGNIKGIEELYEKERAERNIRFADTAYSKGDEEARDILSLSEIRERNIRGFKTNISNTNIKGLNFAQTAESPLTFDKAKLENITFEKDTDLRAINFNEIEAKGSIVFKGVLPMNMKNLRGENIVIDNGMIPSYEEVNGNIIGGIDISNLEVKNIEIIGNLINKENIYSSSLTKGNIDYYKGDKNTYEILKKVMNIKDADVRIEILSMLLMNNNMKEYV